MQVKRIWFNYWGEGRQYLQQKASIYNNYLKLGKNPQTTYIWELSLHTT